MLFFALRGFLRGRDNLTKYQASRNTSFSYPLDKYKETLYTVIVLYKILLAQNYSLKHGGYMTLFIGAHITDEILNPLNFLAKHMQRSKSFLLKDALKHYITEKMEELDDEALIQEIAQDTDKLLAIRASGSKLYSSEEVEAHINTNCPE